VQFKNLATTIKDVVSGKRGVRFCETDCAEELIYPEEKFSMPELLDIEGRPHRFFDAYEETIPPFYVRSLKNGICYTFGDEVYTSGCRVILDHGYYSRQKTPPVRWRRFLGNVTRVRGKVVHLGLIGLEMNYFHWLIDCLARLHLIRRSGLRPDFYVVPSALSFQKEWLDLFDIREQQIVPIEPHRTIQAEDLIVPSFVLNWKPVVFREKGLNWQRQWLPRWIGELYSEFKPKGGKGKGRIYISRANALYRKVENEDSLLPLLDKYGFTVIHSETLPVREQIKAFADAGTVVGLHGAGLVNCVFCPPHASVLELYPQYYHDSGHRLLLAALNLRYFYMVGETPDTSMPPVQENVTIDPDKFEAALKILTA
jgi:capsular polysaccharide biosynthesis protein